MRREQRGQVYCGGFVWQILQREVRSVIVREVSEVLELSWVIGVEVMESCVATLVFGANGEGFWVDLRRIGEI